jgi:uncharacterized protein (DUF433 family)
MEIAPHISVDPAIHHGSVVISGTRVPVSIVLGSLAGGMSKDDVVKEYCVSLDDIDAALAYAADLVSQTSAVAIV